MATIYLIRHGQASFMQAHYDRLSPLGVQQSIALGKHFREHELAVVKSISGTLSRQIDTFKNFVGNEGADPQTDTVLNEHEGPSVFQKHFPNTLSSYPELGEAIRDKGVHDPKVRKELVKVFYKMHLDWAKGSLDSLGHESWTGFKDRGEVAFQMLMQHVAEIDSLAVFTSGGVISMLVGKVLGLTDEKIVELNWQVKNTSITELQIVSGRPVLREFNTTPHLKPQEITFV